MYRRVLCVLLIVISVILCKAGTGQDTALIQLLQMIDKKEVFMAHKEARIDDLGRQLQKSINNTSGQYELNKLLYQEYSSYKLDSAIIYARGNVKLAKRSGDFFQINESNLDLASFYFTAGMYIDAYKILATVGKNKLPRELLIKYYDAWKRLYKFYSFSNTDDRQYAIRSDRYRDSLLSELDTASSQYRIVYAEKLHDEGKFEEAKKSLMYMLDLSRKEDHEHAILCYALANIYEKEGNIDLQRKYLTLSAISDIKNAIKENASMQALATLLYKSNHIEEAYSCIKSSMEDAIFCNARFRTYEASQIFPIINSAYQENELQQKAKLTIFLAIVSILSLCLIIAVILIYRQMKRVNRVRRELFELNQKLQVLNQQLNTANDELHTTNSEVLSMNSELAETNHIKEAYIGEFLNLCSLYIDKLEKFQISLNKMVMAKKIEELKQMLKSRDMIDHEVRELYATFDHVFLHLYPNFVEDFNALLVADMQVVLKPNEVLSPELRIFALIRLGITDSAKIARFLHYSTNTIYTYRTKFRNKAAVRREDFDELVTKIGRKALNY